MQDFIYDEVDRSQLQPLEGMLVAFTGKVQQVVAPSKTRKLVCLQNVRLAVINNNVPFKDRQQYRCQHMWLDVSEIDHVKHQMYLEMEGCAEVFKYQRKDGSSSYGLRFNSCGMTEAAARRKLIAALERVNLLDISVDAKADAVRQLIDCYAEMLNDETIVLFTTTIARRNEGYIQSSRTNDEMRWCSYHPSTVQVSVLPSAGPHRKGSHSEAKRILLILGIRSRILVDVSPNLHISITYRLHLLGMLMQPLVIRKIIQDQRALARKSNEYQRDLLYVRKYVPVIA